MKPEECDVIKRGYALIDMDAIRFNVSSMLDNVDEGTGMVLVIKTDGYGHGAVPIAKAGETIDRVWGYAVACPEEAFCLRRAGCSKPILILGHAFEYAYEKLISLDVRPATFTEEMLEALSKAASACGRAAKIHVKVDTGMGRIGIRPDDEGLEFVKKALNMPMIEVEGLFTHFARADEADKSHANRQIGLFEAFADRIEAETGTRIPCLHCSNSAGILELRHANMDLVRAGITLYGLWPSDEVSRDAVALRPVMSLISHVSYVKTVEPGTRISYGGTYETDSVRRIATVPIGYGDGYPRSLSGRGEVLIRGRRVPIRGRVCMDQFMIDVTDVPGVRMGDKVTLIGTDGDETITMEDLGDLSGRFNYELACDVGKRIPRAYVSGGELLDVILDGESLTFDGANADLS